MFEIFFALPLGFLFIFQKVNPHKKVVASANSFNSLYASNYRYVLKKTKLKQKVPCSNKKSKIHHT